MDRAVKKWNEDKEFISNYRTVTSDNEFYKPKSIMKQKMVVIKKD